METTRFTVNGVEREFDGPADVPLLWVVREELGLTGSKFGCGIGACGACTMHLDGASIRACVFPVGGVARRAVTTIEGLSQEQRIQCRSRGRSATSRSAAIASRE